MADSTPYLSIVVPLYNAAATLPALHREISELQVPGGHELIIARRVSSVAGATGFGVTTAVVDAPVLRPLSSETVPLTV